MIVMTDKNSDHGRVIAAYLHEHFHKPSLGALARWYGESTEYAYTIRSIAEHEASANVPGWVLLRVTACEDFLWRKVQGGGSEGVFALQDGEVMYLTPEHPNNLSRILRAAQPVRERAPEKLATLCCEVFLSRANAQYSVLSSGNEIALWYPEARGYVRDTEMAERLEQEISQPRWEHDDADAHLVFYALVASFQSYQVRRLRVRVPEKTPVTSSDEVVVARVFERIPVVRT
jgi:hypothetical protein